MGTQVLIRRFPSVVWLVLAGLGFGCVGLRPAPPSLWSAKTEVATYMEGGRYDADVRLALAPAWQILARVGTDAAATAGKPAMVLDVDETALSNYEYEKALDFGHYAPAFYEWIGMRRAPAVPAVLAIYEEARSHGIAVFFVTGRRERFREDTEAALRAAGYEGWERLYLKPNDHREPSVVPYKSACRAEIEAAGYTIILNIGDQESDMAGGYARTAIRLPNPMYHVD